MTDAPSSSTCVLLARAHGAQLAGTAPVATGWVLVEQPGPWGRSALTESGLDPTIGAALEAAAGDGVRVQVIRRPGLGNGSRFVTPRTVVLAHTGPSPWAEQLELTSDTDLARLDPNLTLAPTPPGLGLRVEQPLWLVCTHGRRDRCCATYGRPIVDALVALHGDAVWEVSHVGGHRFAGNLVALPDGTVYGALQVAEALRVLDLHRAGRHDLAHLRGRSHLPRAAQAAEVLARTELEVDRRDAVTVSAAGAPGTDGAIAVDLDVEGRTYVATVRQVPTGASYAQSCDRGEPEDPGRWHLTALQPAPFGDR
ncbi:sucrase ferredoxin [Nitriliruptor alkaliphilus]|uniref:sucrase ferredoxin n=1 Tax=Nitriliruptor alkaliphilus TaxID=427918 RepID=UPI000695C4D7|nr:sucrase ferredoxin [Nitriliruptor alkaliphilus]